MDAPDRNALQEAENPELAKEIEEEKSSRWSISFLMDFHGRKGEDMMIYA